MFLYHIHAIYLLSSYQYIWRHPYAHMFLDRELYHLAILLESNLHQYELNDHDHLLYHLSSNLGTCYHLSKSVFLYLHASHLLSITHGRNVSPLRPPIDTLFA